MLAAVLALSAPAVAAAHGWSAPFQIAAPLTADRTPSQISFSPSGQAAVGYSVYQEDTPAQSAGYVALGAATPSSSWRIRRVPGAQQLLALAYGGGGRLYLLNGSSQAGYGCCSAASTQVFASGRFGGRRPFVGGLTGATLGELVPSGGAMLGAVASERGVWVAESSTATPPAGAVALTGANSMPGALAATALARSGSAVAWAAGSWTSTSAGPRSIYLVMATSRSAPGAARPLVTVPAGHTVDSLALAEHGARPTVAWVESWSDGAGILHAQAFFADVGHGRLVAHRLSSPPVYATSITLAADARGDQVAAWRACDAGGICTTDASLRPARGGFGRAHVLGQIDASGAPAVAESESASTPHALVGWIANGHVVAVSAQAGSFGRRRIVSVTHYAADLTLAFSPGTPVAALAVWTQGTLREAVMGARFVP